MLPWLGKRRKHKGNRDIWLRTELEILQVAEVLGLHEPRYRREKLWEWVIGDFEGLSLDLTRDRTQPSADVDLQILRCDLENFGQGLIALIEEKIESIAIGEIEHGVWVDPEE